MRFRFQSEYTVFKFLRRSVERAWECVVVITHFRSELPKNIQLFIVHQFCEF